jgi:hypothetical protein
VSYIPLGNGSLGVSFRGTLTNTSDIPAGDFEVFLFGDLELETPVIRTIHATYGNNSVGERYDVASNSFVELPGYSLQYAADSGRKLMQSTVRESNPIASFTFNVRNAKDCIEPLPETGSVTISNSIGFATSPMRYAENSNRLYTS